MAGSRYLTHKVDKSLYAGIYLCRPIALDGGFVEFPFHEVDPAADMPESSMVLGRHRFVALTFKEFNFGFNVRFNVRSHRAMRVHVDPKCLAHCDKQVFLVEL